jgi:ABC-type branched-subunit amino acid transport system ATPase component
MTEFTNVLEVSGLTVRFGGVTAVDDVSFSVQAGKILGLVGPNGAGKTTIFDAICGFVPSTGKVVLDGKEISGRNPESRSRLRLGRSFQDARLFPSLTVSEALAVAFERHIRASGLVSTALGLPWVRRAEKHVSEKVDELIALMGLGAFRDKFVNELSTGSRRIVDLAAILAHDPIVLLLDEPSSGIAQKEAEALGPLLLKIREETSTTMLVIEHDMPLLSSVSDEVLALETGQVLVQGTAEEVLHDPRLVAAYLGTDQAVVERSGAMSAAPAAEVSAQAEVSGPAEVALTTETPTPAPKKRTPAKKAPAKRASATKKTSATKKSAAKKAPAKKASATKKTAATKKKA